MKVSYGSTKATDEQPLAVFRGSASGEYTADNVPRGSTEYFARESREGRLTKLVDAGDKVAERKGRRPGITYMCP